jgi:inhibitor of cysteine peptidase
MSEITFTEDDNGKVHSARTGDVVIIRLPETSGSGYRWALETMNEDLIALERSAYSDPGPDVGGRGVRTFVFTTKQPGIASVQLKNWREWEGDRSIDSRFAISIKIAD